MHILVYFRLQLEAYFKDKTLVFETGDGKRERKRRKRTWREGEGGGEKKKVL